jgi:hypothetical protein
MRKAGIALINVQKTSRDVFEAIGDPNGLQLTEPGIYKDIKVLK